MMVDLALKQEWEELEATGTSWEQSLFLINQVSALMDPIEYSELWCHIKNYMRDEPEEEKDENGAANVGEFVIIPAGTYIDLIESMENP